MTADELLAMRDDGRQHELIEGVLHEWSPAGFDASRIALRIGGWLDAYVAKPNLGEVTGAEGGFFFGRDSDTVRSPDVGFVRLERLPLRTEWAGFSPIIPDLAVEVAWPSDRQSAVDDKVESYLKAGVPLAWGWYMRTRTVVVHRPGQETRTFGMGDVLDGEEIVPGLQLPIADIFR